MFQPTRHIKELYSYGQTLFVLLKQGQPLNDDIKGVANLLQGGITPENRNTVIKTARLLSQRIDDVVNMLAKTQEVLADLVSRAKSVEQTSLEASWGKPIKTAHDSHDLVMLALGLTPTEYMDLRDRIAEHGDEQTADLLSDVLSNVMDLIKVPSQAAEALSRVRMVVEHPNDPALVRNNVFKAAHALGMKLLSSSF